MSMQTFRKTASRSNRGNRRSSRTSKRVPRRDSNGRFVKKRRVASRPRRLRQRRVAGRPQRIRRYQRLASLGIVREASDKSVAGPALVKRRWWRIDGPVDPSLPEGYAVPRK